MNNHAINTNKKFLLWSRFAITCVILTFLNLLILFFLPGNIYSDLAFILIVLFAFKFMGFSSINIFLYSIIYLIITAVVVLINNYILSSRWLSSISFYILVLFILAILVYIYEEKLESKIRAGKRKIAYSSLSIFFILAFLFSNTFLNQADIKVYFFNKFYTEKYFNETEVLKINGKDIYNKMDFFLESPGDYSIIDDLFTVEGWAIDESDIFGTKIDHVDIYLDGRPQDGGQFIYRCEYGNSGFFCQIDSNKIEDGLRKLYIYFHSNNFEWKYDEVELFINNDNTFIFEDILDKENEDIEFKYSNLTKDDGEIIIEEGKNILKYIKFPVAIESDQDYLVSFRIKKIEDLDNAIHFDFFSDGYDNLKQEFEVKHTYIDGNYKRINELINSGEVPSGENIYFRIFTNSSGSLEIKDLSIYKIIKRR
ncbi:MAG: hypothetical protein ACXWE7_12590 [Nitrososphaeraceae archaeon]